MSQTISNNLIVKLLFLAITAIIFTISKEFSFYWDNIVQISIPANWYFDNNFQYYFLPDEISTGHPTFVAMLFAAIWKITGKSLIISHLILSPFIYGLLWQLYKLTINVGIKSQNERCLIIFFLLIDAALLSQLSLLTFDIIHLFLIFLAINASITNQRILLSISLAILILVSMRSFIAAGGVILFDFIYNYIKTRKLPYLRLFIYIPSIVTLLVFLIHFYLGKGWIIHNPDPNWSESSEYVDLYHFFRNILVLGWVFIDFGRISITLLITYALFKIYRTKTWKSRATMPLLLISITQAIVLFPILLIYTNPFGHRYLLPIMMPLCIFTIHWIYNNMKHKKIILGLIFCTSIGGHFIIYPLKIAQSWDSTTLHWNYYKIAEDMNEYLAFNYEHTDSIGTFFPHTRYGKLTVLEHSTVNYKHAELDRDKIILFSNTFNIDDQSINRLYDKKEWRSVKKMTNNRIYFELFEKHNTDNKSEKREDKKNNNYRAQ